MDKIVKDLLKACKDARDLLITQSTAAEIEEHMLDCDGKSCVLCDLNKVIENTERWAK